MYKSLPTIGLPMAGEALDLTSLINLLIPRPYNTALASARSFYITIKSWNIELRKISKSL